MTSICLRFIKIHNKILCHRSDNFEMCLVLCLCASLWFFLHIWPGSVLYIPSLYCAMLHLCIFRLIYLVIWFIYMPVYALFNMLFIVTNFITKCWWLYPFYDICTCIMSVLFRHRCQYKEMWCDCLMPFIFQHHTIMGSSLMGNCLSGDV